MNARRFLQFLEDDLLPIVEPFDGVNYNSVILMGMYLFVCLFLFLFFRILTCLYSGVLEVGLSKQCTGTGLYCHVRGVHLACVLWFSDNAAIHHVQEVRDAIEQSGARLIFLPPYSPDFNPLEEVFSKVKSYIRKNDVVFQACDIPENLIMEAFYQITGEDCYGYFEHAEYV